MDRQDLNEFIGENLREIAWRKNYPLDAGIAGWLILGTLKGIGFTVVPEQDSYKIFRVLNYGKKNYSLCTTFTKEELLVGWGYTPRASPKALYRSIHTVLDEFDKQVKDHFPEHQVPKDLSKYLWKQRENLRCKARDIMDQALLEYFNEYQETVLATLNGQENELKPKILDELIASDVINFERINSVLADTMFEGRILASLDENIDFLRDGVPIEGVGYVRDTDRGVYGYRGISEMGVSEYVLGCFLLKLAEVKGYPVRGYDPIECEPEREVLERVCDGGWNFLEELIVK